MNGLAGTAEAEALTWSVTCPECRFLGRVPAGYRGRRVRCRACAAGFVVSRENARPDVLLVVGDEGQLTTAEMPAYRQGM